MVNVLTSIPECPVNSIISAAQQYLHENPGMSLSHGHQLQAHQLLSMNECNGKAEQWERACSIYLSLRDGTLRSSLAPIITQAFTVQYDESLSDEDNALNALQAFRLYVGLPTKWMDNIGRKYLDDHPSPKQSLFGASHNHQAQASEIVKSAQSKLGRDKWICLWKVRQELSSGDLSKKIDKPIFPG